MSLHGGNPLKYVDPLGLRYEVGTNDKGQQVTERPNGKIINESTGDNLGDCDTCNAPVSSYQGEKNLERHIKLTGHLGPLKSNPSTPVWKVKDEVVCKEVNNSSQIGCVEEMGNVNETYVTAYQLTQMGFTGVDDYMVTSLNDTLEKYDITQIQYIQHFLAQCRQEGSSALTEAGWLSVESVKKYTQRYEPGTSKGIELGNTEVGDGYVFRGGGYIQVTGRYNYQVYADGFDDPAIKAKIMSEGADYVDEYLAWDASGYWWRNNGMNAKIDNGATVTQVSRGVNRGIGNMYDESKDILHLKERLDYYKKALEVIK